MSEAPHLSDQYPSARPVTLRTVEYFEVAPLHFLAERILPPQPFFNQPAKDPMPELTIIDDTTIESDGITVQIIDEELLVLNALLRNRAYPLTRDEITKLSDPKGRPSEESEKALSIGFSLMRLASKLNAGSTAHLLVSDESIPRAFINPNLSVIDGRQLARISPTLLKRYESASLPVGTETWDKGPALRNMVREYKDNPAIQRRLLERRDKRQIAALDDAGVDSTKMFFAYAASMPLLSAEEEVELMHTINQGVKAYTYCIDVTADKGVEAQVVEAVFAQQVFYNSNLRYVINLAKGYARKYTTVPLLDHIQNGTYGLQRAIEKFDTDKGFKFSTYATAWIKQAIQRGAAYQSRMVRLPVHAHEKWNAMFRYKSQFLEQHHREPTVEEYAERLEISQEAVQNLKQFGYLEMTSLSKPLGHGDAELGDFIASSYSVEESYDEIAQKEELDQIFASAGLADKEKLIIALRFGYLMPELKDLTIAIKGNKTVSYTELLQIDPTRDLTVDEIGQHIGLTRERVRQLERNALEKLQRAGKKVRILDHRS